MKTERECPECGGDGEVSGHIRLVDDMNIRVEGMTCPTCHGTGKLKEDDEMSERDWKQILIEDCNYPEHIVRDWKEEECEAEFLALQEADR